MLTWIRSLFTRLDRGDVAAERIAAALEDIASDIEAARDALRTRMPATAPQVVEVKTPALATEDHAEPTPATTGRNGKARRIAV